MVLDKGGRFLPLCLFIIGVSTAILLWDFIVLPFQNPLKVVGYCTKIRFNPENDFARFLVFVFFPSVLAVVFYSLCGAAQRGKCFDGGVKGFELEGPTVAPVIRHKGTALLLLAYAFLLAINTSTYHAFGRFDSYHEGESLGSGISYLAGLQPYRDFVFFHGLIQDPLRSVWAFQLFGKSIGAERTLESLAKVVLWVFLAFFLDRLFRKKTLATFGVLSLLAILHISFFFGIFGTFFLSDISPNAIADRFLEQRSFWEGCNLLLLTPRDGLTFAFLWVFLEVHGILTENRLAAEWRKRVLFFLLSFIPLAALGYSIDRGVFLTVAYAVIAPILFFFFARKAGSRKGFIIGSVCGMLAAFSLLEFLLKGNLGECLRFIFLVFPAYKSLSEKIPLPIHEFKFFFALALLSAQVFRMTWKGLKVRLGFGKDWKGCFVRATLADLVLTLLSVFYFFNVLVRSDEEHLIYGMGIPCISWIYIFLQEFGPFLEKRTEVKKFLKWATISTVGVILVAGIIRDVRWGAVHKNFPLGAPDAAFIPRQDQAAIFALKGEMKPADDFFTMTSEASWYYYLDKPCPTRFPYIWTAAPEEFQREIVQDLSLKKVKWVLFRDDDWSGWIDGISNEEKFPVVARFIRGNYHPFQNIEDREIWVLNGS